MYNRENNSRISHQAWRDLKDDNGEGLDWLHPLAYTEATKLAGYEDWRAPHVMYQQRIDGYASDYTSPLAQFTSEGRFDTRFGGGSSGEGDERYYT